MKKYFLLGVAAACILTVSGHADTSKAAATPVAGSVKTPAANAAIPTATPMQVAKTVSTGAVPPSLKINGFTVFNSYFSKQSERQNGREGSPHFGVDVSDLTFTVTGKASNGVEYKYRVNFQSYPGSNPTVNQNYIEFAGGFGVIHMGNVSGPEDRMIFDASRLAVATGFFEGGYSNVYNIATGAIKGNDIIGDTGEATKIAYYTPQWHGLQIGFAYTPDTKHSGDSKRNNRSIANDAPGNSSAIYPNKRVTPYGLNNLSMGLTYNKAIGDLNVTLSGATVFEKSYLSYNASNTPNPGGGTFTDLRRVRLKNGKAYQLGMILGLRSFQIGAGYLDNRSSRMPRDGVSVPLTGSFDVNTPTALAFQKDFHVGNAGRAWNVGGSYTYTIYQFGLSYQKTNRRTGATDHATNEVVSLGADMNALRGLKFYGELDFIRSRTNDKIRSIHDKVLKDMGEGQKTVSNNQGFVFIVGSKVSF